MAKVKQTKIGPDLYWVDVQLNDGSWHYLQLPHTLREVRNFRRFLNEDGA